MRQSITTVLVIVVLSVILVTPSLTPLSAQGPIVLHGGSAEDLLGSCAAIDQVNISDRTVPMKDSQQVSFCFGYLLGVTDMHAAANAVLANRLANFCIPENATSIQLAKVFVKYGNDHPEELNQTALVMLNKAFVQSFPCK